jgi:3-oxoacyl-(acyl-carrier-protein) synthase
MRFALYEAMLRAYEVEALSASANGSPGGDRREALAVAEVFGRHAQTMPVAAIKTMLGETLGASGAMQVVAAIETMRDGRLPGIPQLEEVEADFPLALAGPARQEDEVSNVLVNSVGLDGHSCSLLLAKAEG